MTDLRKLKDSAAAWTAKGKLDQAVEAWREVVKLEPRDLAARQKLADALRRAGDRAEAVILYRQVADAYAQDGQPIKAIALGKVIQEIDVQHQATQQALAALYARRTPVEAADDLELDVEIDERPLADGEPAPAMPPPTAFETILTAAANAHHDRGAAAASGPLDPSALASGADGPAPLFTRPLPQIPLFSELSREAFLALVDRVEVRYVRRGDAIVEQGVVGDAFFVVVSGQGRVERRNEIGEITVLARLGEGAFFGEMALLSGAPRAASVIAEEDTELLAIRAPVLHRLSIEHPQVAEALKHFYRQRLLTNLFATSPLFRPFGVEECRAIMERFRVRPVHAGEQIIQEGHPSDGLYVVLSGSVDVKKRKDGEEVLAGHLAEGDVFGEMSCLSKGPASATIEVHRPGILLRLPSEDFGDLVNAHPQVRGLFSQLSDERALSLEAILSGRTQFTDEGLMLI